MLMEIDESDSLVNSVPLPACPGCRMVKNEWPGEGYTHDGETYCCQGCAEGTGCICVAVETPGCSRQGQKLTRAEPRPGEQLPGTPAPDLPGFPNRSDARTIQLEFRCPTDNHARSPCGSRSGRGPVPRVFSRAD